MIDLPVNRSLRIFSRRKVDPAKITLPWGQVDALGQLNAWGHWPDYWPPTWHSTNPVLPPAMAVGKMTSESVSD